MRVLFICHRVPYPPKRGGKIRPFNIIRHLTEKGHRVTVASLARSRLEREEARGLADHCERALIEIMPNTMAWARMLARLPSTMPSSFGYFYSTRLARRVRAELATRSYDLVFVHCSSVAPYAAAVRGPLKILDYGDVDSQKWREYARYKPFPLSTGFWLEAVKLERAEVRLARGFNVSTCTTRAELDSLRELGVSGATDWFPNGVDSDFFQPGTGYDPNLISFVGRMDYYPNQQAVIEFCGNVLPRLQSRRPALRFEVVGADPPDVIRQLESRPGVTVTGSVPDVRPYVARAALTVAPLAIARGTQNKILESMAMGVPVVCSSEASRGVDVVAGEQLLAASTANEYVEAIETVLGSSEVRARLARAGRERVLTHHSWNGSMARLDRLLTAAFDRRGRSVTAADCAIT
ncbi:MAG: TIGR03087 family PEP-CTERM/XrtA system glycosyltransferase [Steroidobacteraceae bacterium]